MTDAQLTLILATLGGVGTAIAAALRWAVNRMVKSQDDATAALVKAAESNATLVAKLDALSSRLTELAQRIEQIADGVTPINQPFPKPPKHATAPRGVRSPRAGTSDRVWGGNDGDDD